ncbi:excinuclease ABC subunit UvrC, partial [Thomasclavelia cocleata]|uniref:excinuclease ABC subunit UvrC n=1 Tax=Thomasclavelia cocleata TaxID=69824 RepID=UPI00256EF842
ALILENNLIKQNKPKFNTLLKDDKTYPYIKVTLNEDYPKIISSKEILKDNAKYFGPFPDIKAMNNVIDILNKTFKLRTCKNIKKDGCIYYHMKTCIAPCRNNDCKKEYMDQVNKCLSILNGKTKEIKNYFQSLMNEKAENLEFEEASKYRDFIKDLTYIEDKQKINIQKDVDTDIIVYRESDLISVVVLFVIRGGKIIETGRFFMNSSLDNNIISAFIKQYYYNKPSISSNYNICLEKELEDKGELINFFKESLNSKLNITIPKKGDNKRQLDLAIKNASVVLNEYLRKQEFKKKKEIEGFSNLKKILGLDSLHRIESFDISHTGGVMNVSSMVVFEDGKPNKKAYRKFKLEFSGVDDYSCMKEVIKRRFTDEKLLLSLPDVLFIDGGEGQINAVKEVLNEINIDIPVAGMVKDDNHNTKGLLFNGRELIIDKSSFEFKLLANIQDETHNFAINYHRKLRNKSISKSVLDNIKGIGDVKKKELLREFKDINGIKNASIDDLCKIKGINKELAKNILEACENV